MNINQKEVETMIEKTIMISEELYPNLGMNSVAKDLFEEINKSEIKKYIIDFTNVVFMSRSFTQEYLFQKLKTEKEIEEINVPENIQKMFDVISKDFL